MNRAFLLSLASLVLAATGARAQSTIFGLDVRTSFFFTSDTASFVGNYTQIATNQDPIYAIDFDATATTLWGIDYATLNYGTFDLTTGLFTSLGLVSGPTAAVTGLTASPDGSTWYVCEYDSAVGISQLYAGDITTGTFTLVGPIWTGIIIDIACDSLGNLYGHSISIDQLLSVDASTGGGTLIGPTGHAANFAQGMDFDWSDDTLYATIYTGGGTGVFATFDLATGAGNVLEDTTSLNAEMEIAIKVAAGPAIGTTYCFGDGAGTACPCGNAGAAGNGCANGTYADGSHLDATGTTAASGLAFTQGTPNQPMLFFQGVNAVNGGMGIVFGDGLRCAGGSVVRLNVEVMDSNGDTNLSGTIQSNGGGGAPGESRYYQGWYRDPALSPCGASFNLSNGVQIDF
ncbi:MAG: hypothetical protein QF903_12885 [Planctomycetota bacterium]|jgi:hypothetical protein|nr:hypothetical protein [Planctomycetota bacterium]MDP6761916.1 hypothetical protein [Planctomycetota bacterium]MDP6990358.1 hypothetical protein [Planctomycetota bacterium]